MDLINGKVDGAATRPSFHYTNKAIKPICSKMVRDIFLDLRDIDQRGMKKIFLTLSVPAL